MKRRLAAFAIAVSQFVPVTPFSSSCSSPAVERLAASRRGQARNDVIATSPPRGRQSTHRTQRVPDAQFE